MTSRSFLPASVVPVLLGLGLVVATAGCEKSESDSDAGTNPCGVDCGAHATCVTEAGADPICQCDLGYYESESACVAYACTGTCGANTYCTAAGACLCQPGFSGDPIAGCTESGPTDACSPFDPCLNGGSCAVNGSGYTCTCVGGASGTNCEISGSTCGTYTDVVYALTARFEIADTPFNGLGNQTFSGLTSNATTPDFVDDSNATPFAGAANPTAGFSRGFARLRFENDGDGEPVAGTVRLVEWYVPLEFTQTNGATVVANTDHSVGILDSSLAACGSGGTACANHEPALTRACASNARGLLVGSTLTWDTCAPAPTGMTSWSYASVASATGAGCAASYNAFGNTASTSPFVPASGKGDSYQSWNQAMSAFVFDGSDPTTATFTMTEMQIPNATGMSTTWLSITASTVIATECGSVAGDDLSCDER